MIHTGLVSVTFRKLSPEEIVGLAVDAGVQAIEWGGDIHVPHGDTQRATYVRGLTQEAGLEIPSYGSYYRVGHEEPCPFHDVLETALALGARIIRVWAGRVGSEDADAAYWRRVIEDSVRIGNLAQEAGLVVAYEYHGHTLTDTLDAALRLLEEVNHPAVLSHWQPRDRLGPAENLAELRALLPWVRVVHVQGVTRVGEALERRSLAESAEAWRDYLSVLGGRPGPYYALIEFVRHDQPAQFLADAATLKGLVAPFASQGD